MKSREKILWVLCTIQMAALYLILSYEKCGLTIFGTVNDINFSKSGSWGQMVSAVGTTLAFFVALANLISARLIYSEGEKKKIQEEETSVFLWLTYVEEVDEKENHKRWLWDINIQNLTKSQIYNWVIKFDVGNNHLCNYQKKPLSPDINTFNLFFLDHQEPSQSPKAEIIFESKLGKFWSKSTSGLLKQVTPTELTCDHGF